MPPALTDDELMELIKTGEAQAFQTLFDRHSPAVFGYCLRTLSGNRALAEDIMQEVWFKIVRKAETYEAQGHFKAWLMTITRNETISQIRKQVILADDPESMEADLVSEVNLEADLLEKHEAHAVRVAIDSLPESQRAILTLSLVDDLSYEQIAAQLDGTVASVRSLLFRARRTLKERLSKK